MIHVQAGKHWMIWHAGKEIAQSVFGRPETEALFQHFGSLLEQDNLQAVTHAYDVGPGAVHGQRGLADDERVEAGKIGGGIDALAGDARALEQGCGFALRVEERDFST